MFSCDCSTCFTCLISYIALVRLLPCVSNVSYDMVLLSRSLFSLAKKPKGSLKKRVPFVDKLRIYVRGGSGGQGYKKFGGHGGKGGDVYIVADDKVTLSQVKQSNPSKRFVAEVGGNSHPYQLIGCPGRDAIIAVPSGVTIRLDCGRVLGELDEVNKKIKVTSGGDGGNPLNEFQGQKGVAKNLNLDLKLIADVGLVGFPNAGKSTLLSAMSRASPKIASYPFTTIRPQVGMVVFDDQRQISVADLPGLIEGAHENFGMGHKFLKHVERTKLLLLVVDVFGFQLSVQNPFRDAFETILLLNRELELYKSELVKKPAIIALNKIDMDGAQEQLNEVLDKLTDLEKVDDTLHPKLQPNQIMKFDEIMSISAKKKDSVDHLEKRIREVLDFHADRRLEEKNAVMIKRGDMKEIDIPRERSTSKMV